MERGKRIRHLKIKSLEDLQAKATMDIVTQARRKALMLVREKDIDHEGVKTVIKRK